MENGAKDEADDDDDDDDFDLFGSDEEDEEAERIKKERVAAYAAKKAKKPALIAKSSILLDVKPVCNQPFIFYFLGFYFEWKKTYKSPYIHQGSGH